MAVLQKPHQPVSRSACFRFYQELNDFLPREMRGKSFSYHFAGRPSVKDTVEAIGVPHPEIDLILVDGESVGFDHLLTGGERVAVYPTFERFDISSLLRLRPAPLREPRFILDVHLGKLTRYLRLLGFDCYYRNDLEDAEIVQIADAEQRIILTRDVGLLKHSAVKHGHWVRNTAPRQQVREVIHALQLEKQLQPFSRCASCNERLEKVDKTSVRGEVDAAIWQRYNQFARCSNCHHVYWKGSHYTRLSRFIDSLRR